MCVGADANGDISEGKEAWDLQTSGFLAVYGYPAGQIFLGADLEQRQCSVDGMVIFFCMVGSAST